jgi:pyrroloquinoline quinone biosynthesis protein D
MTAEINLEQVYAISEDVVVREIDEEIIIVPITSGIADLEDALYTMNPTGKAILQKIDGEKTLAQIAQNLTETYDAPIAEIEQDILGLVGELVKRRMLVLLP